MRTSWLPLRRAAAAARILLVRVAAARWNEAPERCRTEAGRVLGPRGQHASYAELVEAASRLPVPDLEKVQLKDPAAFKIIGRSIPRVDIPSKVDGSAEFGIDVRVPGMVYAVVARCPTFGGRLKRFDARKTRAVPGVRHVLEIPPVGDDVFSAGGVVVVGDNTRAALRGREALEVEWNPVVAESTAALHDQFLSILAKPGLVVRDDGEAFSVLGQRSAEAIYDLPFVAHATMEPMNATVHVRSDGVEAWLPTQEAGGSRDTLARIFKVSPLSVTVHVTQLGGGFGRRSATDFAVEAAQVSSLVGAPVQVVWSREDDIQHDFYRPASMHLLRAALGPGGLPAAWVHKMTSTSIAAFFGPPETAKPEETEIGGAVDLPYAIPSIRVEYSPAKSRIPVSWWRSVDNSINAFVTECFLDELAGAGGLDPLDLRLRLLSEPRKIQLPPGAGAVLETARLKAVLERAAAGAGWRSPPPPGRGRGLACHFSYHTYVAEVAEVSVSGEDVRVHKVHAVVDCGLAVNPDIVRAQIEGAIVYGLSAALKGSITIAEGRVQQSNFHDFEVLRLPEMPEIEVEIVPSEAAPAGVGEPGLPPIAPAVANAVFALTGKRVRRLPIRVRELV
jgi:isoquinoline 1-oxidoreductase beta subunit